MKAAVYSKYGPPEVVTLQEIEQPLCKDYEVLVQVRASTVNRTDCGFRSASYFIVRFFSGLIHPKFPVLGNEFAGIICAVGKEVKNFSIGDRVFGYNEKSFGAHAEYMTIDANGPISKIPDNLSYEEAAPMLEGSHYAYCDIKAAKIKAGQDILINGATGGIGSAAVQLVKYLGASVTAVCETKHIELVKSLGADRVIDYTREDFTKLDQQFDVVFDAVGKSSFGKCKPILKKKGIYMSTELGYMSQNPFLALITPLFGGKKLIFPIPTIDQKDVEFFKTLYKQGHYKPLIDRCYEFDQLVEAYTYVEKGTKIGNVVIRINKHE